MSKCLIGGIFIRCVYTSFFITLFSFPHTGRFCIFDDNLLIYGKHFQGPVSFWSKRYFCFFTPIDLVFLMISTLYTVNILIIYKGWTSVWSEGYFRFFPIYRSSIFDNNSPIFCRSFMAYHGRASFWSERYFYFFHI